MARTLHGLLEDAKTALSQFGRDEAASLESIRALREFSVHATSYRNKYKSQPRVRKAIVASGDYAEELASMLKKVLELKDMMKIHQARIRAGFVVSSMSLSGYEPETVGTIESRMQEVRSLIPILERPSQLGELFG